MKDKEYYYLDTINFKLLGQKTDKTINLNSGVLSDETLGKVLKDIENHLKKTNKELMWGQMKDKPIGVNVLDIKFYKYDEDGNDILNEDGTTKEFRLKAMRFKPLEYLCEGMDINDVEEIKVRWKIRNI